MKIFLKFTGNLIFDNIKLLGCRFSQIIIFDCDYILYLKCYLTHN